MLKINVIWWVYSSLRKEKIRNIFFFWKKTKFRNKVCAKKLAQVNFKVETPKSLSRLPASFSFNALTFFYTHTISRVGVNFINILQANLFDNIRRSENSNCNCKLSLNDASICLYSISSTFELESHFTYSLGCKIVLVAVL